MRRNSLEFKIPLFITIFAISSVLITGALLQYMVTKNLEANTLNKNLIISRMVSEKLSIYVEDAKSTVITAANFSSHSYGDLPQVQKEIFRIYDNFDYFSLIFYMDNRAEMVFSKPSNEHVKGRVYTDRDYYWEAIHKGQTNVSSLLISSVLEKPHFIIASPVHNNSGQPIGLIGAGLPLKNIQKIVEQTQRHFNGRIWMTDEKGTLAIYPGIDKGNELIKFENTEVFLGDSKTDFASVLSSKKEAILKYSNDGSEYYGAVTFVPGTNWMIVVEQDSSAVFHELIELQNQLKVVILIVALIALAVGLVLARGITNPIENLVGQVRKLGYELKSSQPVDMNIESNDEILELSNAFNNMTIRLKENLQQLEESVIRENKFKQYLNNILISVASGILVIDKEGTITIFNKEAESISEFKASDFINKHITEFLNKSGLPLDDIIEDVIKHQRVFADVEVTMISKSGKEIPISVSASPVLNKDRKGIGVVFLFKDLTKMKMIEEELKREDRIRTLGELSASIIHDIGNPLAGISSLIEILKEESYDSDTKKEVLEVLEKEISDLNTLVINFLDFSRNSRLEKEDTNIKGLIDNIINLLKPEIINKNIKVRVASNDSYNSLSLKVDRRSIKQALLNIVKNSLQAVNENGNISIELRKDNKEMSIVVKDDGEGIGKDKIETIFYPFYTTKEEGTGLGLSIAYKQVKEHNGTIRVKSTIGVGTEFTITLPVDRNR